jgi:hypothetical protein
MPPELILHSIIPNPEDLLALEPEELAGAVLEVLNSIPPERDGMLNRYNFTLPSGAAVHYPPTIKREFLKRWQRHGVG